MSESWRLQKGAPHVKGQCCMIQNTNQRCQVLIIAPSKICDQTIIQSQKSNLF